MDDAQNKKLEQLISQLGIYIGCYAAVLTDDIPKLLLIIILNACWVIHYTFLRGKE